MATGTDRAAHGFDGSLTWVGHGTFLLEAGGSRVLVDGFVDSCPTTPDALKGEGLGALDLILVTHGHVDHVADVAAHQRRTGAQVAGMVELMHWFERSEGVPADRLVEFNKGGTIRAAGMSITMVDAKHSSATPDGAYAGEPAGFVVRLDDGFAIYFSGDTTVFGDMALIGAMGIDLAVLSIGDHYTMGPELATTAVELLEPRHVVGGHWGTFPPLVGTPQRLAELTAGLGATVHPLQPGDVLEGATLGA